MKNKLLIVGILSLLGMALSAADVQAGNLGHWRNRFSTRITCRPYNAFTPFCYGNLVCDGCCAIPSCNAGGCFTGMGPPAGPACSALGMNQGFAYHGAPQYMPMYQQGSPVVLPANPGYAPMAPVGGAYMGQPSNGVQPAGYNPGYGYYPMPSPYYWQTGR